MDNFADVGIVGVDQCNVFEVNRLIGWFWTFFAEFVVCLGKLWTEPFWGISDCFWPVLRGFFAMIQLIGIHDWLIWGMWKCMSSATQICVHLPTNETGVFQRDTSLYSSILQVPSHWCKLANCAWSISKMSDIFLSAKVGSTCCTPLNINPTTNKDPASWASKHLMTMLENFQDGKWSGSMAWGSARQSSQGDEQKTPAYYSYIMPDQIVPR